MTEKRRVEAVCQDLTASERGLLVLRARKEGEPEDSLGWLDDNETGTGRGS